MKLLELLESHNAYARQQKNIARDVKKFRKQFDKTNEKKIKEEEKFIKKQERENKKETKRQISDLVRDIRSSSKTKESLLSVIQNLDKNQIEPKTLEFISWVVEQADKLKTNKKDGTILITRNFNLVPKILNNPIVGQNKDPKVISIVSKLVRTSNIELHPKFNPRNKISNYRMLNNILFNVIKDLVLTLIHNDIMKLQGVKDVN